MAGFKIKYPVNQMYFQSQSSRRTGVTMPVVRFVVAHDTESPDISARDIVNRFKETSSEEDFSAHIFIDDKEIIECIPALSSTDLPEKANHVPMNVSSDNWLYGVDANDGAIGVVYCYGKGIDDKAAYQRYVWVLAYLCHCYGLDPNGSIIGHCFLDPQRKSDPKNGLAYSNRSYVQLLIDVVNEYNQCIASNLHKNKFELVLVEGKAFGNSQVNIYMDGPYSRSRLVKQESPNQPVAFKGWVKNGECLQGNQKWFVGNDGNYFWSGEIDRVEIDSQQLHQKKDIEKILVPGINN